MDNIETIERRLWTSADTLRANSNYASKELRRALVPQPEQQAREMVDKSFTQTGGDVHDPDQVNIPTLRGIAIRYGSEVWSFSIESDAIDSLSLLFRNQI